MPYIWRVPPPPQPWPKSIVTFPAPTLTLLDGLTCYWKLDEASGTRVDVVSGEDLTAGGSAAAGLGKIGSAANLVAASSQYLSHADDATIGGGDIDWTFNFWINWTTTPSGFPSPIAKDNVGSDRDYDMYWDDPQGKFKWEVFGPAGAGCGTVYAPSATGTPGTWYMITVDHSATTNTIGFRVNGGARSSSATTGPAGHGAQPFYLGCRNLSLFSNARLDEVGYWKRSLTDAEATALYGGGYGLTHPFTTGLTLLDSLDAYWKLDEASGNRADSDDSVTLTDHNTVTQQSGKIATAAQFVATNLEYLDYTGSALDLAATESVSISGWFSPNAIGSYMTFVNSISTNKITLLMDNAGLFWNWTTSLSSGSTAFSAGAWTHFVYTFQSTGASVGLESLYLNGVLVGAKLGSVAGTASGINIGRAYGGGAGGTYVDGGLDEIGYWRRCLSGSEVAQLYGGGAGYAYPFTNDVSVTGGIMAASSAAMPTATVATGAVMAAGAMTATTASMPAAAISGAAVLTAGAMTATTAQMPAATGRGGAVVQAGAMTATTAQLLTATIGVTFGTVFGALVMTADASMPAATVAGGTVVQAGAMTAAAAAPAAGVGVSAVVSAGVMIAAAQFPAATMSETAVPREWVQLVVAPPRSLTVRVAEPPVSEQTPARAPALAVAGRPERGA